VARVSNALDHQGNQFDTGSHDGARQFPALLSIRALQLAVRVARSCLSLLLLLLFRGSSPAMLSSRFEIDAARPGWRKAYNLPSGVEPSSFFKVNAATIFTIAKQPEPRFGSGRNAPLKWRP
jgi:hypothetical protein